MDPRKYIVGTCKRMCPEDEIKMRERENLLHVLEMLSGTEKTNKPKADKKRMVKSYIRSGAGQDKQKPEHLRTPGTLLETVHYLLDVVTMNDKLPWHKIYDFIVDRLQAVRQDMVIQNLPKPYVISILQPVIRFYAYASYRLCEEDISKFDPALNNKHLQECLKKLLVCYDYYDDLCDKCALVDDNFTMNFNLYEKERPYFESLYLLFNLGHKECAMRALSLSSKWRTPIVEHSLNICLNYVRGNYVKLCRQMRMLPPSLLAIAALHLPEIRRRCLRIMNVAYSSKILGFPVELLSMLLIYEDEFDLISDCKYYNIHCDNQHLYFLKGRMSEPEKNAKPKKLLFLNAMLSKKSLPSILLHGDL